MMRLSERDTHSLSHDLEAILERSIALGLVVDEDMKSDIADLNEVHNHLWHRYPSTYAKPIILIHQFDQTIEKLFVTIRASWNETFSAE